MKQLTKGQLHDLVESSNETNCQSCNHDKFISWGNKSQEEIDRLELIGEIANNEKNVKNNGYKEYHPNGTNYWSENAPVALAFYPYHESKVLRCPDCYSVFLHYVEYQGHAPQKRVRWINKKVVITSE